jgi:thymidylate synthase
MSDPSYQLNEEKQYLDLVRSIIATGDLEAGRNGNTLVKFGHMMRFSLRDGQLPLLTTKRVAYKTCFKELLWFIRGQTDNRILQKQNVHIWDGNASREFLDGRGLTDYPEGTLGPVYGFQWRHFGADYDPETCGCDPNPSSYQGVDQLQQVIDALKDPAQRSSRRIMLIAWNPQDLDKMALPPCHVLAQFHVTGGTKLSCALYQRSCDVGLGVPFNIASYSYLTHLLAKYCGLEAEEFVYFMGNTHIYEQHIDGMKEQLERTLFPFPKIRVKESIRNGTFDEIVESDIELVEPYICGLEIRLPFVA